MASPVVEQSFIDPFTTRERLEVILSHLDKLPTLPVVAAKLLAVTSSQRSSAKDVVQVIETDAALTAGVLRLVRRADLGVRAKDMTVAKAVTLLGFRRVRNAVLSLQLYGTLGVNENSDPSLVALRRDLWKHSLAVACATELLVEQSNDPTPAEDAFVCGLLHDVGKIALDVCLPKSYARVAQQCEQVRGSFCDAERAVLGLDHTIAGKRLATKWRLPDPIIECIWLHHQHPSALPSSVRFRRHVELVHLADHFVRQLRIGYAGGEVVQDVTALARLLNIDPAILATIASELPKRMAPLFDLIGLDADTNIDGSLFLESLHAANHELALVNARLLEANQKLEVRSLCFDALALLSRRLSSDNRLADVCAIAAECISHLVHSKRAMVISKSNANRCIHVGIKQENRETTNTGIIQLDEIQNHKLTALVKAVETGSSKGITKATDEYLQLWEQFGQIATTEELWTLPIHVGEDEFSLALFEASIEQVEPLGRAPIECEAVVNAINLAVASAGHQAAVEQTNEELFDLHRRLSEAQAQIVRERSLGMIGEMAAGAAHEINTPLAVISGRAQMLQTKIKDAELKKSLNMIVEQASRASKIVADLMRFAKPETPKPALQTLEKVVESLCQHWRHAADWSDDQIKSNLSDPSATIYADPRQLAEVLDSVMANSIDACKKETACVQINSTSRASDDKVRIVIKDNGIGMTPEVLEHAVDPFFSSQPAGRRRGLGLSRAVRLVEINGGALWLSSVPESGTQVTIDLPAHSPST